MLYAHSIKLFLFALAIYITYAEKDVHYKIADICTPAKCQPPNCRCSDSKYPSAALKGREKEIPQFITVTFDDAVTKLNYPYYEKLFDNLVHPDNCSARGTFFVSHEYTDYSKVNALYTAGHEIALHSITHNIDNDYWRNADVKTIMREFGQSMDIFEKFAKIDKKHLRGMRLPFLQIAGNSTYEAARRLGLEYDASWPTLQRSPAMWPYTLDYESTQDCTIGPCPQASIPGVWVHPMVSWIDANGFSCSMMDSCSFKPKMDVDDIVEWMMENFKRHYEGNRAPFGMYLHASWFLRSPLYFEAFRKFLERVIKMPDVYVTSMSQVMDYMRNPVAGKPYKKCFKNPETDECIPKFCALDKVVDEEKRYMMVCGRCPEVYPWLDNPMGKLKPKSKNE